MAVRLTSINVNQEYPGHGKLLKKVSLGGSALLQKDYGKALDCTLTCLAFIFGEENYGLVEKVAFTRGYNGERNGTYAITVKGIMRTVMRKLGVSGSAKSAYLKGVCWDFEKARRLIDEEHYVILNTHKDGRNYYKDHSVTIIGYAIYENNRFLLVYDNWYTSIGYIDYDKLGKISSLNWYE